jgi:zinc protease
MKVAQTVVNASLPGVKRDSDRYYALEIASDILGGNSLTARLGHEIRDKRGLAYYAESTVGTFDHAGYVAITFATRNEQANAAVEVFLDTLKAFMQTGVTQEELDDAKSYLTGSFPLGFDNQPALASELISMQHFHLGIDYMQTRNARIGAVTLKETNDAIKKYLSHTPLIVMVGQPQENRKP